LSTNRLKYKQAYVQTGLRTNRLNVQTGLTYKQAYVHSTIFSQSIN
ncbi:MAG: hypothetical protein ACI97B_004542, partial [Verrucomicrobiales bacterium]